MKKVLCIGSAGFILSNFIRRALFNKSEYSFVSIDACLNPNMLNNIYVNKGHRLHIGSINDIHFLNVIFEIERPEIVILGTKTNNEMIGTSIQGVQNVIEASRKWEVEQLLYLSSDKVYSSNGQWSHLETESVDPSNLYEIGQVTAELLIKKSDLKYNILRLSNNYGPRQSVDKLIPTTINNILNKEKTSIYGKGQHIREWTHVDDTFSAIISVLESGKCDDIYNVSSNFEISNLEMYQEICNIVGSGHDLINFDNQKESSPTKYTSNSSKLRELGWKPAVKFKKSLEQCVGWYLANKWWFKS